MRSASSVDRLVLSTIALCVLTTFLAGCMAGAAVTVASQTVKTTARAAGAAARITVDGAKAVSHTVTKPFRQETDEEPVN